MTTTAPTGLRALPHARAAARRQENVRACPPAEARRVPAALQKRGAAQRPCQRVWLSRARHSPPGRGTAAACAPAESARGTALTPRRLGTRRRGLRAGTTHTATARLPTVRIAAVLADAPPAPRTLAHVELQQLLAEQRASMGLKVESGDSLRATPKQTCVCEALRALRHCACAAALLSPALRRRAALTHPRPRPQRHPGRVGRAAGGGAVQRRCGRGQRRRGRRGAACRLRRLAAG
jgi:hypothetical protein